MLGHPPYTRYTRQTIYDWVPTLSSGSFPNPKQDVIVTTNARGMTTSTNHTTSNYTLFRPRDHEIQSKTTNGTGPTVPKSKRKIASEYLRTNERASE